ERQQHRWGRDPGRHHRSAGAASRRERDARLPDVRQADPRQHRGEDDRRQASPASHLQKVRRGDRQVMATATKKKTDTYTTRLKDLYEQEIRARLQDELGLDSIMQVPKIQKITLNMGVGEAKTDSKAMDAAIEELTTIAGQRAQVRKARKSIAQFKVREGMAVG